ncbi:tRNA (34-2'-O)-methyltransferase regulator WDR6 [Periplaneta americana]|uniref:tRNA (34-2'-O)-methyltransferase regulator WDR6 n=1 Tax=Periplaneta americana TaxID=6978 RepID=UPI0037E96C0A
MNVVKYESQYILTDVTAVKFVREWILAGIGGTIQIFEIKSGKLVTKEEIFEEQSIHHIFIAQNRNLAVVGGKRIQLCEIEDGDSFKISRRVAWCADDWIQYLTWLECGNVVTVTAHNKISLWNGQTGQKLKNIHCQINCILYCALLDGSSWDEMIVFAGTVFQQVLVWAPASVQTEKEVCPVLHTLEGHDGVIFSVSYDSSLQLICTSSDDRSVRLWTVHMPQTEGSSRVSRWRDAQVRLLHTLYGHTARVWRNVIVNNAVISVGEDSRLCIWGIDGSLQKSWKTHQNGSVWSIDYNKENNLIVTGGGDGGISLWPFYIKDPAPKSLAFHADMFAEDCGKYQNFPRKIGLTNAGNIIAVTDSGCLLYCTMLDDGQGEWKLVFQDERLASYCLLEMSPCMHYVALASIQGFIFVFVEESSTQGPGLIMTVEEKAVLGRVFSVHWLTSEILLTCGHNGLLEMWKLCHTRQLEKMNAYELPKGRERWISAASLRGNFLVCGDRNGSIHLFKVDGIGLQSPLQTFSKIHGRMGVSSLVWHENRLLSTGRDGTLRQFLLSEEESLLEHLSADKLSMDWPAVTVPSPSGLLVLGFKSVNFWIWSHAERRTLMTIPCGGGHRSWDSSLKGTSFTFIYLKDKKVHHVTFMLDHLVKPVILRGFHSKLINCMCYVPGSHHVLVSASEDTTVRVTTLSHSNVMQSHTVHQSHISSVRVVSCCTLPDYVLMFSAGGRAQLKVWKLCVQVKDGKTHHITCQELQSHMIRGSTKGNKKPWQSQERPTDPETRYMDLCAAVVDQSSETVLLAAGCSDGFLRLFVFCASLNEFRLAGTSFFHKRCILKVSHIETECQGLLFLTMATNGRVAFWDLRKCVEEVCDDLQPFSCFKVHQSGINSYDWRMLRSDVFLLATGGDDSALVLSVFQIVQKDTFRAQLIMQWRNDLAHLSQITGLRLVDNMLVSTSIDQRIKVWKWSCHLEDSSLSAYTGAEYCSIVPDIQGLLTWKSSSSITACVYGKGMEIVDIRGS